MKKTILLAMTVLGLVGCSDEEKAYISLTEETIEATYTPGAYSLHIEANCDWEASADASWVTPNESTGTGTTELTFTVSSNPEYEDRTATLTIQSIDGSAMATLQITQHEKEGVNKGDTPVLVDIPADGGTFSINVLTNTQCQVVEMPEWVSLIDTRSLHPESLDFTAEENRTGETRSGRITIEGGEDKLYYTVTQPSIEILAESISFQQGTELTIDGNYSVTLTPVFQPENCTNRELIWSSSASDILEVDANGTITPVTNGIAVVTALNEVSGLSATMTVLVKIRANDIALADENGNLMLNPTLYCNSRTKFSLYTNPTNAYTDEVSYSSENPDLVSISDGYLVTGAQTGSTTIHIIDNYTGNSYSTYVTVSRVSLWAGYKSITQTNEGIIYILGGGIRGGDGDTIDVLSAWVADNTGRAICSIESASQPSNEVTFQTGAINFTELFGVTSIGVNMPSLRFLVAYRLNGSSEIYQDFVDINLGMQVK